MSRRAQHLHQTVERQIAELAQRLSDAGEQALTQPCRGREKLGDGTIGAVAAHTTDNYHRIARFLAAHEDDGEQYQPGQHAEIYHATHVGSRSCSPVSPRRETRSRRSSNSVIS